ncbi:MAG: HRDC domain-containing protein [Verrucomicrobiota bacterium]
MQLKLFIVPVKNVTAAEAEMNAFLRGHRVLAVKKEFVPDGENSFWTFCVEHLEGTTSPAGLPGRGPKVDYREVLSESDFSLFSKLRDWRKAVADKDAIPVYAVLSNEQLAAIVQKKVTTKAGLKEIEGVGEARLEKYGDALVQVVAREAKP